MDIKILDSWLREFLDTKATPLKIAEYLSLCGPSIERVEKYGTDSIYDIEVTTNRIDSASVYGIAREASAILPRFGIKARLKPIRSTSSNFNFVKNVSYLKTDVDVNLCPRFTAILIKNVTIGESPNIIKTRLESTGIRAINNIVDISNYIMLELGQPVHTFDYDKIKGAKMILRPARRGESITTLDGKNFILPGGDIVIEDGEGRLIDLAGIMGGDLSAVDDTSRNVLLFIQTYNPVNIRKTSMSLAQRTQAATIFEKGTDPELVAPAILNAIELFKDLTKGTPEKEILDIYPSPYKPKSLSVSYEFIEKRLGIELSKKDITDYLSALEFETAWKGNILSVSVPSFRSKDIAIPEDIIEEIARIYGYHNLPSKLMNGNLPARPSNPQFLFEQKTKNLLAGWGGTEVYTLSLVPEKEGLKLANPLGSDTEYLRVTLIPSLMRAAKQNLGTIEKFHLFEMANVYIPRPGNLPEEKLTLAGVFNGYSYREAKGIIEAFLAKLNIRVEFQAEDSKGFAASKGLSINSGLGKFGVIENSELIYYEFSVSDLFTSAKAPAYKDILKYPAQVEDLTLVFPPKTRIGEVINLITNHSSLITNVELKDIYKDAFTLRVEYQSPTKTLTNEEVEKVRKQILSSIKSKFGGTLKD